MKLRLSFQKINTCQKKPYRCNFGAQKEIKNQITELLKYDLIEESDSPFAFPVTFAFKRDENKKNRLCIDFRELNKIVIPECQPFPIIEDIIPKAVDCSWFTVIDINSAFWSIPVSLEDRPKTAFVTQNSHFQWKRLPFGLRNSLAVFQRALYGILRKNKLQNFAVNYIDDVLIFSKNFEEHVQHIDLVFKAITLAGFKIKLKKCKFAVRSVKYLGHVISKNFVRPLNDNLESIKCFPIPTTKKNVRQFL